MFQRADGRWVLKTAPHWRQTTLPREIRTKRQAEAEAARLVASGGVPAPRLASAGPTVGTVADDWLKLREARPDVSAGTLAANRAHLRAHILPTLGDRPLAELTVPELRLWVRGRRALVSPHYCRNVHTTLVVLLDDAIGEGWLDSPANPARAQAVRAELPAPRAAWGKKVPRIADIADVQRLLDCPAIPLERAARYALALTLGLRDGEIAGLRWRQLRLEGDRPQVAIDVALAMHGKAGYASDGKLKTDAAERTLPLHPAAVAALEEHRQEYWLPIVGRMPGPDDYVFVGKRRRAKETGFRPKSAELLRKDLEAAGVASSFGEHALTFHALRRTVASHLAELGVPADVRAQLLGHSANGAEAFYVAAMSEQLRVACLKIALVWRPGLVRGLVQLLVQASHQNES